MPNAPFLTTTKWIALGLIVAIIAALIFLAGAGFGSRRDVMLMHAGGERGFSAFGVAMPHVFIMHGHGAVGQISTVSTSSLTVAGPDGPEVVLVNASTTIESMSGPASLSSLVAGMHVVILGEPSGDSGITATLIRIMPEPPQQ